MKVNYRKNKWQTAPTNKERTLQTTKLSTVRNIGTNNWTIVYCYQSQCSQPVMGSNAY